MKGNNELHLNEATVIEALQEYFDKRMNAYSPKVESVSSGKQGYCNDFVVKTTDRVSLGESDGR